MILRENCWNVCTPFYLTLTAYQQNPDRRGQKGGRPEGAGSQDRV